MRRRRMSEAAQGILVLSGVSVIAGVACHLVIKRYVLATLVAALAASSVFHALAAWHLGYLDPFLPLAFVVATVVAALIAGLLGIPFGLARRKKV